jgi:hypothetical protein
LPCSWRTFPKREIPFATHGASSAWRVISVQRAGSVQEVTRELMATSSNDMDGMSFSGNVHVLQGDQLMFELVRTRASLQSFLVAQLEPHGALGELFFAPGAGTQSLRRGHGVQRRVGPSVVSLRYLHHNQVHHCPLTACVTQAGLLPHERFGGHCRCVALGLFPASGRMGLW